MVKDIKVDFFKGVTGVGLQSSSKACFMVCELKKWFACMLKQDGKFPYEKQI